MKILRQIFKFWTENGLKKEKSDLKMTKIISPRF
jgi:hypothetical protein